MRQTHPLVRHAQKVADGGAVNVGHLIYKNKFFEGHYKDYEFSNDTMSEHWASGLEDIRRSFGNAEWFAVPGRDVGFVTHDVHRYEADPTPVSDTSGVVPKESALIDEVAKVLSDGH